MKNIDLNCEKSFIPLKIIIFHFEKLSKMVGDKSSLDRNLSKSDLNSAAEIFFALNSCPTFYVKLYSKLIYGNESKMTKFASNIIRKAKDGFKARAQKIFAKISSVIGFQHISYHHEGNGSNAMNNDLSKNMLDIKGITMFDS